MLEKRSASLSTSTLRQLVALLALAFGFGCLAFAMLLDGMDEAVAALSARLDQEIRAREDQARRFEHVLRGQGGGSRSGSPSRDGVESALRALQAKLEQEARARAEHEARIEHVLSGGALAADLELKAQMREQAAELASRKLAGAVWGDATTVGDARAV